MPLIEINALTADDVDVAEILRGLNAAVADTLGCRPCETIAAVLGRTLRGADPESVFVTVQPVFDAAQVPPS